MKIVIDPGRTLVKEDIHVQVFNAQNLPMFDGYGDQTIDLPIGLYTVHVEFGSQWRDEVVRHAGATTRVDLYLPERPSAVPVWGTATSHEYYSYTSQKISQVTPGSSGIFLFIRAESQTMYRGEWMWENLFLLDAGGKQVLAFGPGNGEENRDVGYYGTTVPLAPGMYILQYKIRDTPREMPLYVFDSWQTQVFIFYRDRPLVESATILMDHWGKGFDPDDRIADAVDMALGGLQSGTHSLPTQALNILLMGKFENPMLGLLGAHYLLRREKPDLDLLNTVLHNLNYLIPHSPDVVALAAMANAKFGLDLDFGPLENPPMIRAALEAIYGLSASDMQYADLVPPGSLLELIASRRYIDSVYSSWKPAKRVRSAQGGAKGAMSVQVDPWVFEYLKKQKEAAETTSQPVDLPSYAKKLNLPLRTVDAAWKMLAEG